MRTTEALILALLWAAVGNAASQPDASPSQKDPPRDAPYDRHSFVDGTDTTLDDPRQITARAGYDRSQSVVVLRGGLVFDGTGAAARPATVIIEGKRIARLVEATDASWSESAQVVDLAGRWVMPGLIDLHTHLTSADPGTPEVLVNDMSDATLRGLERARFYLESGITTVRDVASHGTVPFRLKKWVSDGRVPGPRIFAAGQIIIGTGGHGADFEGTPTAPGNRNAAVREASGPDDWRNAVREQFKRGADLIKIGSHFSAEEIGAAVEEAHSLGLRVTVDAETRYADIAAAAGVDCIEHPLPRAPETIMRMARQRICAVPTLVPYQIILDRGGYYGTPSRRFSMSNDKHLAMLESFRRAGVRVGVGTDLVSDWFRFLPEVYWRELQNLVAAGYSTTDALIAATRGGAEILGLEDRLGTLRSGMLADILVTEGRPDLRLEDLARVHLVVRDGRVVIQEGRLVVPPHVSVPLKRQ